MPNTGIFTMGLTAVIIAAFLGFSTTHAKATGKTSQPPNIVIIMADDMGFDDVSFHGKKQHLTPNIDAIALHGMGLHNLYAPPICTPSRATLMTGRYPVHTGTQQYVISNEEPWGLPSNITTIAEVFKGAGYSTHLVGKWHLGLSGKHYFPTERGFDTHYGYLGGYIDYYHRMSQMPLPNASIGYDFRRNLKFECENRGTYVTELLTTEAEAVIDAHDTDKSLFLMLNHLAPHTANTDEPLQAPKDEIEKFNYIEDEKRRIYAAMVSKLDESIGNITKKLEEKQILNNTILIFYSDNGAPSIGFFSNTGSNYPMRGQKNTPFEGGVHIAGAIWSPLLKNKKSVFEQRMYVGDFLPTLASAAGIPISSDLKLDGIDLWEPLTSNSEEPFDRDIVHMLDDVNKVVAITSGAYKYIKGTTLNGQHDSVLMGRQKEEDPRNVEYAKTILNSMSSKVLAKYDENPLTEDEINTLRGLNEIKCANPKDGASCNAAEEECLFDIYQDPCEENNLAKLPEFESVMESMRNTVEKYRSTSATPANMKGLSIADPSLHDCAWERYLEVPQKRKIQDCSYRSPCPVDIDA